MRVLLAGASGLIGTALAHHLQAAGHRVVRLVRVPGTRPLRDGEVSWDPAAGSVDLEGLDRAGPFDGAVNLAGAGIGDRRWSPARKDLVLRSRVSSTRLLVDVLARLSAPPPTLVNASAVGAYGDRGDELLTEDSPTGAGFLADLCRAWESAALAATGRGTRTVLLRSGIVLAPDGGALARLVPLFRFGLGARTGSGQQFRSWISIEDEVRVIARCLEDRGIAGPVNATSPNPVTDATLAKAIAAALHRPAFLAVPSAAIRLVLGAEMADEFVLGGQRAVPAVLAGRGHHFTHPDVDAALAAALGTGS